MNKESRVPFFRSLSALILALLCLQLWNIWRTSLKVYTHLPPTTSHITINTALRKSTTSKSSSDDPCFLSPSKGPERSLGFQALTKIQISPANTSQQQESNAPKILCIVVPTSGEDDTTIPAILDTYATHCDDFVAISRDITNAYPSLVVGGSNDWERLLGAWQVIEREYSSFDAYHFVTDTTYVIPENLRSMLMLFKYQSSTPLYLGGTVVASRKAPEDGHCGGSAGYTINRATLELQKRMGQCSESGLSNATVYQLLAKCLEEIGGIRCKKTTDETSALRYLEFGLDFHARFSKHVKKTPIKLKPLAQHHGIYVREGLEGISTHAVSFNVLNYKEDISREPGFTPADAIRRFHAILYGQCRSQWDDPPTQALSPTGQRGYVHDPQILRHHPPDFTMHPKGDKAGVCENPGGKGKEGEHGIVGLAKIRSFLLSTSSRPPTNVKVLCMIYTHSGNHATRLRAVAETYGPQCDGFIAASNLTDPSIGAVNLLHEGPESYGNMWLKVRSMWRYAYQHYLQDFDLFHIGGDDHFLIPENLRFMVDEGYCSGKWNESEALFLGGNMVDFPLTNIRYCGGGSGYTLNRQALRLLVERLWNKYQCGPHLEASDEDRKISECFRSVGVTCMDTNDAKGESRYHQASVEFHASWTKDEPSVWHAETLDRVHGIVSKELLGQISESSISFHLKGDPEGVHDLGIRRYHAILHSLCSWD
eukprot:Nitzschia sp. Nitz4//scaffold144_size56818//45724//47919//NITZ4_006546-RA/size56818-snap-gene-0.12-mRNA-1//-1//CDS//3329536543//3302//frame0